MGTYPPLPGNLMRFDLDGTKIISKQPSGADKELDSAMYYKVHNRVFGSGTFDLAAESAVSGVKCVADISYLFPEPRTITGFTASINPITKTTGQFLYSLDTTDGINGEWTLVPAASAGFVSSSERDDLMSRNRPVSLTPINNVKGVRTRLDPVANHPTYTTVWLHDVSVFGYRTLTATDRLEIWSPTADTPVTAAELDFEDVAAGIVSPTYKTFRIKNLSATKTVTGLFVQFDSAVPDIKYKPSLVEFSLDAGETWSSTLSLGTLAPNAVSPIIRVRFSTLSTASSVPITGMFKTNYSTFA